MLDDSWAERLERALGGLRKRRKAFEATLRRLLLSSLQSIGQRAPSAFAGTAATSPVLRMDARVAARPARALAAEQNHAHLP